MRPRRGLVLGRFQPLHNGHLAALQRLAPDFDEIVVAIGSADVSHSSRNPFTAAERFEMIRGALTEAGVPNAVIVPVQDMNRNAVWVAHVTSIVPAFDVVFTNNAVPRMLFEGAGFTVQPLPLEKRDAYEGTRIRELMATGGDWDALVPPAVAAFVRAIDGPARLAALAGDDARGPEGAEGR